MSSARATASAASALYALYRPAIGTRTGSNALATAVRTSISLDIRVSATRVAETSRSGRVSPQDGHDQSPSWARTTRSYCSARPTARAARRVADRLRHAATDRRIVDAEVHDRPTVPLAEPRDDRVVGVEHERHARIELLDRVADAPRKLVELEVAIHLIAEQIRDQHDARADALRARAGATPRRPRTSRCRRAARPSSCSRRAARRRSRARDSTRSGCGSAPSPRRATMSESIRAVVVFPFVPDTSATPCASSLADAAMKSGSIVSAMSPGSAVPPRPLTLKGDAREPSGGVRDEREGVGHPAKPRRRCELGGRLDLAQQDLELVHRATETHHHRLRALAVRALAKLAHRLEACELGDGLPQPRDRERCREVAAQKDRPAPRDARAFGEARPRGPRVEDRRGASRRSASDASSRCTSCAAFSREYPLASACRIRMTFSIA